jgi:hypothetical protein
MLSRVIKNKKGKLESLPFGYESVIEETLFRFAGAFLSIALARESFLGALFFTRLQVEGMSLDFLDDVLLLDLALETAQRAFQGFSILDVYFCQTRLTCLFTAALACGSRLLGMRYARQLLG